MLNMAVSGIVAFSTFIGIGTRDENLNPILQVKGRRVWKPLKQTALF